MPVRISSKFPNFAEAPHAQSPSASLRSSRPTPIRHRFPREASTVSDRSFMAGFGFGAPAAASQPLFGAPAQPSLFGAPAAASQPLFGAPAAASQSLFGAPAAATQSLFGAPAAATQSLFGAPAAATQSLFGAPAAASQSLFGAPAAASQSLFGAPAQPAPSLFGAPQQQQSAPSLFGAPQQQQQSAPSLFGAPAAPATSLFGAPAASQSLFGAPAASQSLFGAPAASQSLFGAPASSQSLFGAPAQPSMFGAASQPQMGFGAQPAQAQAQAQAQQAQPAQLPRLLTELVDRLNPMHPESQMHAALYNVVAPCDVSRYARPAVMDERLWDSAVTNNPDPSRMVPVQANNFDDLLRRSEMQATRLGEHAGVLSRVEEGLGKVESEMETEIASKLAAYRRRHRELARKLLRLASAVEMGAASADGGMLSQMEVERKRRLDGIARALAAPAEFKDKLSDLVELAESHVVDRRASAAVEIRDGRAAAGIKSLLGDQLKGIQHLASVCERAERDAGIMAEALAER